MFLSSLADFFRQAPECPACPATCWLLLPLHHSTLPENRQAENAQTPAQHTFPTSASNGCFMRPKCHALKCLHTPNICGWSHVVWYRLSMQLHSALLTGLLKQACCIWCPDCTHSGGNAQNLCISVGTKQQMGLLSRHEYLHSCLANYRLATAS